ncbi:MAG: hypothetical protein CR985_02560 [Flavobacteriales bacterium]|nr:MAG: hypothetical protein CR985_02560 [Flavobacteriales bacterium]
MDLKNAKPEKILEQFETKKEKRSLQTYLRNQNKFYLNSFNLIDRKAAIMIRVNSMIISAIIIFFNLVSSVSFGNTIAIILILSCFLSLMFALNASRPHSINHLFLFRRNVKKYHLQPEETIFISGATTNLSIEEYQKAFDKIVKNQKLQIGNQARAMHILEKRIRNSFIHIELSYLAFMIGFIAVVLLFVIGHII